MGWRKTVKISQNHRIFKLLCKLSVVSTITTLRIPCRYWFLQVAFCSMNSPRSILITGCSGGIGLHVAAGLMRRGYRVFPTARKREDVAKLVSCGMDARQLDLASSASIQGTFAAIVQETGGTLYALFNNGAYGQPGAVEDLTRETLREQFEVNLFGTHELTRLAIPIMRRQGYGRIFQNSSLLGFVALKYRGAYNASKYALEGLTDTLRLELAGSGIFVSLIEPGPILSNFRRNAWLAYRRNIIRHGSYHDDVYAALEQRLLVEGAVVPFTLGPEAVLKRVIQALESVRPRARYSVTFPAYLFAVLKRILPVGLMDRILARI
jgi:Short-chain dehydrogenases of various substrate specificities